jgi:hypothetical protein
LVRQEAWELNDDEIMSKLTSAPIVGSEFFRYFEELLQVSIHVCTIFQGERHIIPDHVSPYIWTDPYPTHIVLFENKKLLYGQYIYSYQILTRRADNQTMFDREDSAVKQIITEKHTFSVKAKLLPADVQAQIIDPYGKCRFIFTRSNEKPLEVFTRPLNVPVIESLPCPLFEHIRAMNDIKIAIHAPTIDISRCSTSKLRYFPDNESFVTWYNIINDTVANNV